MSSKGLFDRVANLIEEIGTEKTAGAKAAMDDPGGYCGKSSHPSTKGDDHERKPSEGEQSADNERRVDEMIQGTVNKAPELTPANAPKYTEVQLGEVVGLARATGEDPTHEHVEKGKPEGDKKEGDQGGTSHIADGSYGEKYSADRLATATNDDLFAMAAELGNELVADIATGQFGGQKSASAAPTTQRQAADAGAQLAKTAQATDVDDMAADVLVATVKVAHHQADLVAEHLAYETAALQKQAEEEMQDPTGGGAEGEDHGTEEDTGGEGAEGGGAGAGGGPGGPGAAQLMASMAQGGNAPGGDPSGGAGMPPGGDPSGGAGMPPGGDPTGGAGMPPGGDPSGGAGAGGPPAGMENMPQDQAIQQLAMALLELGIDPQQLAQAASQTGQKIASVVQQHKRSGKFHFESVKQGSYAWQVREYMKGYVNELLARSR